MDLLATYDSTSSEDEEEHDGGNNKQTRVTKRRRSCVRVVDRISRTNAEQFVRSVPHVRGNWAGHVFLKLDEGYRARKSLHRLARRSISVMQQRLEAGGYSGNIVSHVPWKQDERGSSSEEEDDDESSRQESESYLHVSLSRPFYLQLASISSFVADLRDRLSCERAVTLAVGPPKGLVNDDGTRTFWCRSIPTAQSTITRLLQQVDQVMLKYKQPTYYDPPLVHVSLASVPGNMETILDRKSDHETTEEDPILVSIPRVYCAFGTTKEFAIDLVP